tara:strand:+ start:156017 stop:156589 length:573 start_codon:yes stop_codon:yes gene_type:complete
MPKSAVVNDSITELWARDIRRVAQSGDWILTRSYSKAGDAIVAVTLGESFSHASIYDAERGTIIEAIDPVVREVPLESLLRRNRYAVIVRPVNATPEAGQQALARARSVLGAKFDHLGLIGVDDDEQFYCSELIAWASEIDDVPRIVTPAELFERGEVIYLSGARDEEQLQAAALASSRLSAERVAARDL